MAGLAGCANQREVVPLLHVEANAPARIFYFEKRALGMFPELRAAAQAAARAEAAAEQEDEEVEETCSEPALVTWGAPQSTQGERSSCAPQQND